ncbi:Lipopolysaccharide export system permease protein LptG [Tepidimonas alkaliphilus]|uniref:Lipopolysaccharide export system permease protein LptG n=1 Tax=Tepidimonas alkaliphilus TaxID=2588942 RepID=A0A554WD90_9BURK|nr:LPS export ABC transporter permease LptG [Tepidimonas alkaliphilus]TSE21507.1 Lipopolysaccharide export system permease protein LptG [Tepidimonas alkaliphilus]
MLIVRRLVHGEAIQATLGVLLGFLALFAFFDLVEELGELGTPSLTQPGQRYGWPQALLTVGWLLPSRAYELLPIAVLIGTVWALTRLARDSEFVILRTSGLGPGLALRLVIGLGLGFALLTFVIGDYVAPAAARQAQLLKAQYRGGISAGATGAWLRERQDDSVRIVNVQGLTPQGELRHVRVYRFDAEGRLREIMEAERGQALPSRTWTLQQVRIERYLPDGAMQLDALASLTWPTELTTEMLQVALLKPERMGTLDLFRYVRHLERNDQNAQRYAIEFWRKLFYPLGCVVMVVLALPFAYLHFRQRALSAQVFVGVMMGISYALLNGLFGHIGNLLGWAPWLAAGAPAALYLGLSLAAFAWLVLRR